MKRTIFSCVALMLIFVNIDQILSLQVQTMDTPNSRINVEDPSWNSLSSGILKSHSGLSYRPNRSKTLILSSPAGYGLFAAIRILDLRPNNQDSLTLFVDGAPGQTFRYSNSYFFQDRKYYPDENVKTFYAPNGQLGVTFTTGPSYLTQGFDGFEFIYTVQANWTKCSYGNFYCDNRKCISKFLTCDGHNHCGDLSDQKDCSTFPIIRPGSIVGIISGVILFVAVASLICIYARRASRSRIQGSVITHHPPSNNPTPYPSVYPQVGGTTVFPPPPPPYSPYNQGISNPSYH